MGSVLGLACPASWVDLRGGGSASVPPDCYPQHAAAVTQACCKDTTDGASAPLSARGIFDEPNQWPMAGFQRDRRQNPATFLIQEDHNGI
jgi:hypothetical protein